MVGLGLCKIFKFIGLFHTMNGPSSFDLNVRGFHRSMTAPRPHFKLFHFFSKKKSTLEL